MGYVVFALERAYGTCMLYQDVVWLVAVTLTNLGYGEFTPRKALINVFFKVIKFIVTWAISYSPCDKGYKLYNFKKRR